MKRQPDLHAKALKALTLRSTLALLPFVLLASTGTMQASDSTFTATMGGSFETGTNWTNGVPGVDGGSGVPATLNSPDTATFFTAATSITSGSVVSFTDTHNLENITTAQGGGTLVIGATTGPSLYLTDGGKLLQTGNLTTFAEPMVLEGSYTFDNEASASRITTVSGAVSGTGVANATLTLTTPYAANNVVSGRIGGATAAAQSLAVVKNGAGNWLIGNLSTGAPNNYTGGTTVNAGYLGDTGQSLSTGAFGSGTVTLSGGSLAVAFNSTSTANTFNNPLVVTASTSDTLYMRAVTGEPAATIFNAQSVGGTGTLILSGSIGTATSSTTTINAGFGTLANGTTASTTGAFGTFAGTLQISPNNTTNGSVALNITNAAALASTAGLVSITTGGILTSSVANINSGSAVSLAGGTLTPNGTSVGMLTLTNNGTFSMTSGTLGLTLTSTTAGGFDQIVASGAGNASTFTLSGGTLDLGGVVAAAGNSYQILSNFASGTVSGITFTDYGTGDGSTPTLSSTGLLSFTAVPEPAAWAQLAVLGVAGLGVAARQRRASRAR